MNYDSLTRMIEQASPQEKRQFKAWLNVELDLMRNVRRAMAEGERKIELGEEENEQ